MQLITQSVIPATPSFFHLAYLSAATSPEIVASSAAGHVGIIVAAALLLIFLTIKYLWKR